MTVACNTGRAVNAERDDGMSARWIRLWRAQEGRCSICGGQLYPRNWSPTKDDRTNEDHVWPRKMKGADKRRFRRQGLAPPGGRIGNTLLAHAGCNVRKGNRRPTGCEQITLLVVNLRTGERPILRW